MEHETIHLTEEGVKKLRFLELNENDVGLDLVKTNLKIQDEGLLSSHCLTLCGEQPPLKYTPMQFTAKHGLVKLFQVLLRNNIDPNFSENRETKQKRKRRMGLGRRKRDEESDSQLSIRAKNTKDVAVTKEHCDAYPLLLAAENGHHEIIKLLKYHNFSVGAKDISKTVNHVVMKNEDAELQNLMSRDAQSRAHRVNFRVTNEHYQTVLHLVFQQPLLACETSSNTTTKTAKQLKRKITYQNMVDMKNERLQEIATRYRECIKVLLDLDRFDDKEPISNSYPQQIRSIVNDKDIDGNTPLHCAVLNWSEDVVKKLLSLGANASIKNDHNEIPLTRISRTAFEDFLNKQCIIVEGFDASDDEVEEDSDVEEESKVTQDYNPAFMMTNKS